MCTENGWKELNWKNYMAILGLQAQDDGVMRGNGENGEKGQTQELVRT